MSRELGPLVEDYRVRESMWCTNCGSSTRERDLWNALSRHYEGRWARLRVAEINRFNAAHDLLSSLADVTYAEYPEQDIQSLTWTDESFDLVITSDTLEHVPDYRLALAETRRVLRPNGRHVLTVPLRPDLPRTRARIGLPPVHHGEPPGPWRWVRRVGDDMLALHDIGADFPDIVREAGFEVELHGDGVRSIICATKR